MAELDLTRLLLLLAMAVGPLGTHRLLLGARGWRWQAVHLSTLACAAAGMFSPASFLCGVWLLFCAGSFAVFLWARRRSLREPHVLAACVPFLFSNVAAVWLVAGENELGLLGYGAHFSAYAALHGNVLGWILVGAIAALADRPGPHRRLWVGVVFVCFASFLLVALGIDQLRWLKPLGVIGLSIAIPIAQVALVRSTPHRGARALAALGLAGLAGTMLLAWGNELSRPLAPDVLGIRGMVAIHGVANAVIVAPSLLAAVALHRSAEGAG